MEAIRRVGNQLAAEREPELQTLVSAAFVRLSQEAASKRCYPAMQQTLASLDSVEAQRPGSSQAIRPRIGAEDRLPEFIEEALRNGEIADGMLEILNLMPGATLRYIVNRFAGCGFREDCELLGKIVQGLGEESVHSLEGTLQTAPAAEAVETVGLLCMLSSDFVEKVLPMRLAQWPRTAHDRVVRQVSAASPLNRAKLLVSSYDSLDMFIRPLAIDEMGMSGQPECIPLLLGLAAGDSIPGYTRLKSVEALGRLRAQGASGTLQHILEAKQVWRWGYPMELRIAAAQALMRIDPTVAFDRMAAGGLERRELTLEPTEPEPGSSVVRQRRYARLKLSRNLAAVTSSFGTWPTGNPRRSPSPQAAFPDSSSARCLVSPSARQERPARPWRQRAAHGAGLADHAQNFRWSPPYQGAGHRQGRAPASHRVRICGYGPGGSPPVAQTAHGIRSDAASCHGGQPEPAPRPAGPSSLNSRASQRPAVCLLQALTVKSVPFSRRLPRPGPS